MNAAQPFRRLLRSDEFIVLEAKYSHPPAWRDGLMSPLARSIGIAASW